MLNTRSRNMKINAESFCNEVSGPLMKFRNYVSYMKLQHDEDPLYIFDEKFGEVAPGLLKDYNVPHLFQEDFFDVLNTDERPPYRWFIIGPEDTEIKSCATGSRSVAGEEKQIGSDHACQDSSINDAANCCDMWNHDLAYDINFLSKFLDEDRDHYNSMWSASNCIGQREMREWLWRLWIGKPGIRDLIWKGACLAVNAGKWLECIFEVCRYHYMPSPGDDEKLPVGTGSNPVYLIEENVIKIYVEGGLETSLHSLGAELEFYNLLRQANSPLKEHVPDVLASGFVFLDSGSYTVVPWDGKEVPNVIADTNPMSEICKGYGITFGLWSKKLFDYRKAGSASKSNSSSGSQKIWPYIVTKRCKGKILAELRDSLSWENALILASFLGEQLYNLHKLPLPQLDNKLAYIRNKLGMASSTDLMEIDTTEPDEAAAWEIFLHGLAIKKKDVVGHLRKWEDSIPGSLIEKVVDYLPEDMEKLYSVFEGETCCWIH